MEHNKLLETVNKKPNKVLNAIAIAITAIVLTGLFYWALVILSDTL